MKTIRTIAFILFLCATAFGVMLTLHYLPIPEILPSEITSWVPAGHRRRHLADRRHGGRRRRDRCGVLGQPQGRRARDAGDLLRGTRSTR